MRSLSVRLLLSLLAVLCTPAVLAHDITLTGTQSFASLDGSSSDHDGAANGVFTVSDGNLVVNGIVNCNDDGPGAASACAMAFNVSGNLTINGGGALYAENRTGAGSGGAITLTVGGNLAMSGNAIVSTASKSSSGSNGGAITANVAGNVSIAVGSTIDSGATNASGGAILLGSAGSVVIDGNVLSGPSRTILGSRLTGDILSGGTANQTGGAITIASTTFAEPAILVGPNANIVSQGEKSGAGPVTLDGCGIEIRGLVAATARSDSSASVAIRSGKSIVVDGRDLGAGGLRLGRIRVDASADGAIDHRADFFASEGVTILGPSTGSLFAVSANPGGKNKKDGAGTVRVISLGTTVTASGLAIIAGVDGKGTRGGTISIQAAEDVNLNGATLVAIGDYTASKKNSAGGTISVRAYSGDLSWSGGTGDVRPVGSTSGIVPADQGKITLTACGTINTAGATFPVQGVATGVFPLLQNACSPAVPSLPSGVPPLVTCNTPPVANDVSVSGLEDVAVTITLSGTDVDGDPLTFSIVTPPAHAAFLGPIVPTGPNTATITYSPIFNYNGTDSFVYQANDGNGGTDTATVTITLIPVNDEPVFFAGPTASVLEDSGAQSIAGWATGISAGAADEAGQIITFVVTNDNASLFSVQPALAANGTLTFTPAPNAYGTANLTIVAIDNGGTANGGDDTSPAQTTSINVIAVNDEPSFVAGANQSALEDAGPQTVAGWATAISAGPNEIQTLTFQVTAGNPALFSAGPSIASNGTLTWTPAPNANGTTTVSVILQDNGGTTNGGDDTSPAQTFTISIVAVNDAPSFTSGGNVTVNEDSGAYSAAWASAISAGPADESGQSLTFSASNDNNALFSAQPSISPSGVLTFTPAANAFGSATVTILLSDNGGTANGGADTSASQTFSITVSAVNDEPTFTAGGNVTVDEDSGSYSAFWATAISAGPGESQTLIFVATNDNNALFASQPAISPSGTLTFTPAVNANGTATVTVFLQDDGGTANGGDDTSASATFTIVVTAVNDEPSFVSGGNVSVNEDSGAYSAAWATGISAGPADESGQSVAFFVSNDNNALFSVQPSVSASGVLTFTPAANASGTATVNVYAQDNGGTANGGDDTSATQTFTITVNGVNDAPSFTSGGNVTVNEDSGAYSAPWATAISAGPGEGGQTVTFSASNDNNALFSVQPSISAAGVLTFTPAPNAFGSATVSVFAQDNGGTANGGVDTSATVAFTITVNGVNDPPTAGTDSWETFGNTELRVDLAAGTTPHVADTTPSTTGVLHNDADAIEGDPFAITGVVGCADVTAPFDCAVTGGTVSLNANGTFTFQPSPGATSASFQYTVTDMPSAGAPASANGTVTITIHEMIWYVNGAAPGGGNGTSASPFNSFAPLNGADPDDTDDYIFVHSSNVSGSIALEQGQRLWGEGIGLTLPHNLNGNGGPTTLVAAGIRPKVSSAADTVTVSGVSAEIAGLELSSGTGNAIDVTSAFLSAASTTLIYSNAITAAGAEGIDVNAGSSSGTTVHVSNTNITSTGNGFDVSGTLGTVVVSYTGGSVTSVSGTGIRIDGVAPATVKVTGFSNVTISGVTAGDGIRVTNAQFDANAGTASFETVSAGAIAIGSSGDAVGAQAMVLSNVSGDLAFGSLDAHGATHGVTISGSGLFTGAAGMRVTSGGGAISVSSGTGLRVTDTTIAASGLNFTSISAANAANGIHLYNTGSVGGLNVTGTGTTAGSGGTIQNMSARGASFVSSVNVSLSNMNFTNAATTDGSPCGSLGTGGNSGCNAAIHFDGVVGVSLNRVAITGSAQQGINVRNVTGFALANSSVTSAGNAPDENGLNFYNLMGTSSITNSSVSGNFDDNAIIQNDSGSSVLTISSSQFSTATQGSGLLVGARGSADVAINVTGSTFHDNFSGAIPANATDSATLHVKVTGSTITNNNDGISVTAAQSANVTFDIFNNGNISGNDFTAISVFQAIPSTGTLQGKIRNNTIGVPNGRPTDAINVSKTGNGSTVVSITGNVLSYAGTQRALLVQAGDGSGALHTTITGNSIDIQLDGVGNAVAGILAQASTTSGGAPALCADIGGAALLRNTFTHSLGGSVAGGDVRLRQRFSGTVDLPGFAGLATDSSAVISYLAGRNTLISTPTVTFDSSGFSGGAACAQPVVP